MLYIIKQGADPRKGIVFCLSNDIKNIRRYFWGHIWHSWTSFGEAEL